MRVISADLIFAIAHTASAPSARMVHTQGRGGASQSEVGGWPTSIQGETEGAKKEEERREEEGSNKSVDEKNQDKDNKDSKSISSGESETEERTKPPTKIQASTESSQDDVDEGKEGMADDDDDDDDDDDPSPCNVEAHHKVQERWPSP